MGKSDAQVTNTDLMPLGAAFSLMVPASERTLIYYLVITADAMDLAILRNVS